MTVRLTSLDNEHHTDGGGKHQWAVAELGADVIAQPESSNHMTFTLEKPGTYTFYCDICCGGKANPTIPRFDELLLFRHWRSLLSVQWH